MALINPNIALSYRPTTEYKPPNALADFAQLMQIQSGMNQNELAKYTLGQAQRTDEQQKALFAASRQPGFTLDFPTAVQYGAPGLAALKAQEEAGKNKTELHGKLIAQARDLLPSVNSPESYAIWRSNTVGSLPHLATFIPEQYSPDTVTKLSMDADRMLQANKPITVGSSLMSPAGAVIGTAPTEISRLITARDALITSGRPRTDPDVMSIQSQITKLGTHAPSAQTNINTYAPASVTAQQAFMKKSADRYERLGNAPAVLANIEKAKLLIPAAGGFMGTGGDALLDTISFLNNRLGANIDVKGITAATELRSRLFNGVLDNLKNLDASPSQQQQAVMQQALGTLGTDPNALANVLDSFADILRDKVAEYNKEVQGAEKRNIKFPYDPTITLPEKKASAPKPLFAVNKSTGEHITSIDGGKTWAPVGAK